MTGISLCLIVRNESRHLADCVASARAEVDRVLIVDTGSSDGTQEIARELSDEFHAIPFEGDFSRARNFVLDRVTTPWVLFLDADERLTENARLSEHCDDREGSTTGGMTLLRYNFFADGGFFPTRELKLFRGGPDIRYERIVNESVAPSLQRAGHAVDDLPVILNHFGHCRPLAERTAKAERYLDLFTKAQAEDPDDAFYPAFVALISRTLGDFASAAEHITRALDAAPDNPVIRLFHGHVLRASGSAAEALDAYRAGLRIDPRDPALLTMAGIQSFALGDHEEAVGYLRRAQQAEPALQHIDINLGLIAEAQGRWADAVAAYERAAASNPAFTLRGPSSLVDRDYYSLTHYETPFGYRGLGYHLAYARMMRDRA
ncbi:glycosyltransferase [Kitasatospora sp. NBC_01287]|uniref:TPR domain-containing glycosyltransferase n=1 Tax=Kitasatospora sp. NBC_01287 TaxID=2903573 RepID=UPI0022529D2B|nr:TPR domain-containing glycosyltransferase [Kitasatospora sp. NBC_01287]MCX4749336.1 glycosyltransferase [Kitasatospora sp. NBC_01287]